MRWGNYSLQTNFYRMAESHFHTAMVPSADPLAKRPPSSAAKDSTLFHGPAHLKAWQNPPPGGRPSSVATHSDVSGSQILMVPSTDPVARKPPCRATLHWTLPRCPWSVATQTNVSASQILTLASRDPLANRRPSNTEMQFTSPSCSSVSTNLQSWKSSCSSYTHNLTVQSFDPLAKRPSSRTAKQKIKMDALQSN